MGAETGVNPFEQQHQKEVAERKEANRQFAVPGRIGPLPPIIDVGEQVIGSRHVFELGSPAVIDNFRGTATVLGSVVSSDPGGRPSHFEEGLKLEPGTVDNVVAKSAFSLAGPFGAPVPFDPKQPEPLRVEFHPQMAGPVTATLNLKFYWSDGGYTERIVILRGRSHALGEAPHDSQVDRRHEPEIDVGAKVHPSTDTGEDFRTALRRAHDDLATFKAKQALGIDLAEQESSSFQEAPPEAPWWTILADIAITMGVAAIAGIAARFVAQELTGKLIATDNESVIRGTEVFTGVSDGIKDGLKGAFKKAAPSALPPKPSPQQPAAGGKFSTNSVIEFWTTQRASLIDIADENRRALRATTALLSEKPPEIARAGMQAVASGITQAKESGEIVTAQAFATETQWISGIAQGSRGAEAVQTRHGEAATAEMSHVEHALHFIKVNGVLQIGVDLPDVKGPAGAKVTGATITGISQEIADRIWKYPLAHVPMPITLEVTTSDRTHRYTRDEAGRVRVDRPIGASTDGEPQQIRDATLLFEQVLARSLQAWGLPQITTDDATKRANR